MASAAITVPITYPESDGKPLAENTLQYEWIEKLKGGLEAQFSDDPEVFVAADLLWYPVEGNNRTRQAPDVFVVFGRPKGYRGSYRQWDEGNIAPQVVFEILSPGNRVPTRREGWGEMVEKAVFYVRYGVEEYYLYDPHNNGFDALIRSTATGELERVDTVSGFVSPRLGIRFDPSGEELRVFHTNGELFKSYAAIVVEREQARHEREHALQQRDEERERAERLAARLRELGIDPETV